MYLERILTALLQMAWNASLSSKFYIEILKYENVGREFLEFGKFIKATKARNHNDASNHGLYHERCIPTEGRNTTGRN